MFISCVFPHEPILHALFYILCYIYTATSIIRSLSHMHKPFLGFSALCLAHTPTTWVFSPEISSLRPFCQQTILSAHHLWVFPTLFPAPRPPRGFSPRESSRYAHFASKPYSPHIISGFFRPLPLPYAHRVGFLPGELLSTPISPA